MEKGISDQRQGEDELDPIPDQEVPDEVEIDREEVALAAEQEPESQEPEQPKRRDAKSRINEVTRQKYQAIEQMKAAMERAHALEIENEQLKRLNSMTTDASVMQQETTALERLERAKERKSLAIESGDIKSQVDADIEIAAAVSEVQKLDYEKTYRKVQEDYDRQNYEIQQKYAEQQAQQYNQPEVANRHIAEQWLAENDWYVKGSPNFNPKLHDEVRNLCEKTELELYKHGQQHKIGSEEFFIYINQQIPYIQQRIGARPPMSNTKQYVEPVRNSSSGTYSQKQRVTLSQEQKDLIRGLGVKPEDYLKHQRSDQQKRKANFEAQRGGY